MYMLDVFENLMLDDSECVLWIRLRLKYSKELIIFHVKDSFKNYNYKEKSFYDHLEHLVYDNFRLQWTTNQ